MQPKTILHNRFKQFEFVHNVWSAHPEHGVTIEDVKKPEYWAHITSHVRAGDRIDVLAEDFSFHAVLVVESKTTKALNVRVLSYINLELPDDLKGAVDATDSVADDGVDEYSIEWVGGNEKHRIIRISDGEVIESGFITKKAAQSHIKAVTKK